MKNVLSSLFSITLSMYLVGNDNVPIKEKYPAPAPEIPSDIENTSRSEEWILYLVDSWGDGWNGASLDLSVNGTVVLDDATIATGTEAIFYFDVEEGDYIETFWTSGSYDSECAFGIYDVTGTLITDSQSAGTFELAFSANYGPRLLITGVLDLDLPEGGSSGKALIVESLGDIQDLSLSNLKTVLLWFLRIGMWGIFYYSQQWHEEI